MKNPNQIPQRLKKQGKSTGVFLTRECPQNKIFNKNPGNIIIGELFKDRKNNYFIIYKETLPIMKDGFMSWHFDKKKHIKIAGWRELK